MNDADDRPKRVIRRPAAPKPAAKPEGAGERIAKVLSRAGIASRREAERMIELGQVTVNGKVIESPALNVTDKDRITVAGQPLAPPEPARLWLYYKPEGLVTSASDEKGRETVFDRLPPELPRVMSIGRLDLNSEGLLLLTNDGELKRRLELPSTGWLRKYRVRVNGNPMDPDLEPLRKGIVVEADRFQPMEVSIDRIQGANAWLTVGLREGKNREIRRAMSAVGLTVNRLIRVSYGPFRLNDLQPGQVEEVRGKVLRDQLGLTEAPEGTGRATARPRPPGGKPVLQRRGTSAGKPAETEARPGSASVRTRPTGKASQDPAGPTRPDRAAPGAAKSGQRRTATGSNPAGPTAARPRGPAKPRAGGPASGRPTGKNGPPRKG